MAREIALRKLTQRAHSRAELAQAMQARHVPQEAIDEVLDRFTEVNLVDDAAFAAEWARSRHEYKRSSKRVITEELRHKGIDQELIVEAVSGIDRDSELAAAREIAAKKARSLSGLDPAVAQRRLAGALARRGYGPSVVQQVVREATTGSDEHW
ncbi:regulatory protein RecX [Aestuariimicrobium ganziense]|uniref:regulatory protein RecX n=1 Tax=Aestuariimicrobium ganziense TaxID=2773677 RepID=UPI001942DB4E|nr:regulatory protein RecX [Aestuariimicrobium ganziense]